MLRRVNPAVPGAARFYVFVSGPDSDVAHLHATVGGGGLDAGSVRCLRAYDGRTPLTRAEQVRLAELNEEGRQQRRLDPHKADEQKALCRIRDDEARGRSRKAFLLRQLLVERFTCCSPLEPWDQADAHLRWDNAGKTMLVLWGHSQGVASALSRAGSPLYTAIGQGGFGYSPITGDALTPADIAWAIRSAKEQVGNFKLDLLAFDSCYMSTAEAAYELRGTAKYLLASQSAVPLAGLDYTALGNAFAFNNGLEAEDVARAIIRQVGQTPDAPPTMALVNLNEKVQDAFRELLCKLAGALLRVLGLDGPASRGNRAEWLRVRAAFENAGWHRVRQFIDLSDLCYRIANYCRDEADREPNRVDLRTAALDLMQFLDDRQGSGAGPLVVDARSAPPWIFGGLSICCSWLLPTPEEAAAGAWNAAVREDDYKRLALFTKPCEAAREDQPALNWADLAWNKELLDEARNNAFYRELRAIETARTHAGGGVGQATDGAPSEAEPFRTSPTKPPSESSFSEETLYTAQSRTQAAYAPLASGWSARRRY